MHSVHSARAHMQAVSKRSCASSCCVRNVVHLLCKSAVKETAVCITASLQHNCIAHHSSLRLAPARAAAIYLVVLLYTLLFTELHIIAIPHSTVCYTMFHKLHCMHLCS
jgi:hypothetical protein